MTRKKGKERQIDFRIIRAGLMIERVRSVIHFSSNTGICYVLIVVIYYEIIKLR